MNIIIALLAGLVAFAVGALWYSVLFGKAWMKAVGITEEAVQKASPVTPMIVTLVVEMAVAVLVSFVLIHLDLDIYLGGLLVAGIAILSAIKNYMFEMKPFKLILINESYKLVTIMIMTASVAIFA
ncbi:hypothetical protein BMT55_04110 [Listeria newyorkensis]|uniref:DUF1761 domain-containing protein n=1 Tax=Listeria newyorkensis TaxID=1497681 RepID=A0ABX4XQ31_9LIST|nr:DUF1761 domain-containing protein [Listeria newyorkensis]KGL41923.1 hypothetical protein EP58_10295 [Listeria newyorkensis]KMT58572.1 hypothetical protein X559_3001 [Listeria newyorkensis]PNP93959.1 hypothetical protein BMT55_04110 [Listeria newyorkensis]WAO22584.1 DUF1761 domain-containing protein [Listeria newyorkensis]SQC51329.1 Uncharacterised protein [Listeria newyorkensis]